VRFEASIDVAAPAKQVFAVYADVERWPSWTPSVTRVERLDTGPLQVGSRARVRQPRLPVAVWEVTELEPDRSFTWVARGPGVVTTGVHRVEPAADAAGATVTAALTQGGPLGPVLGLLTRRLTTRYVDAEVRGLKAHCEAG
jgi:uncharacterized membrane protein